ncbi:MerR family transcriptional regulator [Streptomyces scabiei]|uniref:helix-turn-helix domain-containing protein n=1 Tax=Streptomyces scabiei TaxID=1930 RepID=UPI0038F6C9F1
MRTDDGARPTWSIGAVARQVGLPVTVIRHWSERGVVAPSGRTAGGYRRYDTAAVARLHLARTLRDLGLGLGEIRAALDRGDGLAEVAAAKHADGTRSYDPGRSHVPLPNATGSSTTSSPRRSATWTVLTSARDCSRPAPTCPTAPATHRPKPGWNRASWSPTVSRARRT